MDYKSLKKLLEMLRDSTEQEVTIEKEVAISIVEEVLLMRRRNTAKIRHDLVRSTKQK